MLFFREPNVIVYSTQVRMLDTTHGSHFTACLLCLKYKFANSAAVEWSAIHYLSSVLY